MISINLIWLSPKHPVDVAVVEEKNGIERRRFILSHIPIAAHDLYSSNDHQSQNVTHALKSAD